MPATLATVNGILKEVYEGGVTDQLDENAIAIKRIEKSSEGIFSTPGGKYVVFPLHTQRNSGISYRAESAQLGPAGQQGYAQAQERLKYGYGRIKITGPTIALADSNPKSFINALDGEMNGLKKDLTKDCNRIAWGNSASFASSGKTGGITVLSAPSAASTTVTAPTQLLQVGEYIDITASATGVPTGPNTGRTIVSITSPTAFVVDAVVTASAGDIVVRNGNTDNEPYGLAQLVDDAGTLHGINSGTAGNEYWRSIDDGATTALTELVVIKMMDDIKQKSGGKPSVLFSSLGVRRTYFNLLTSLRRYNEPKQWDGGLVGLAFMYEGDLPFIADPDQPPKSLYAVQESEVMIYRDKPWYWEDIDGSVLKYVHDYDVFEALMKQYWQIVTHKRGAHGRFTNLTES
jgi:hypothetical protein